MLTRILEAALLERKGPTPDHRWFRLVTPRKDAHGTVILPDGGDLSQHKKNPLFLWMHRSGPSWRDPSTPGPEVAIGIVEEWDQTAAYLDVLVRFDDKSELAMICRDKVAGGFIRCCSVGFDPAQPAEGLPLPEEIVTVNEEQAAAWPGTKVGEQVPVIRRWVLLEASLVLIGSNGDALAYLRSLGAPTGRSYLPAEPVKPPPPGAQKMAKSKLTPEARWMYRGVVTRNMEAAEHCLRTMEHAPAEHQEHLRSGFQAHLDHAQKSMEHLRDSEGEDEGDSMTRARRPAPRVAPGTRADLAADRVRFSEVAAKAGTFEIETVAGVVSQLLGSDDAETVDAKITALQGYQERYRELKAERQVAADDVTAVAREAKVTELQDGRWMTPAQATRARTEKWSLSRLATFESEAKKEGSPVPIVRTRDLRGVEDATKPAGGPVVVPASPTPGQGGPSGDKAADAWAAYGSDIGLDPDKVRARVLKNRAATGIPVSG